MKDIVRTCAALAVVAGTIGLGACGGSLSTAGDADADQDSPGDLAVESDATADGVDTGGDVTGDTLPDGDPDAVADTGTDAATDEAEVTDAPEDTWTDPGCPSPLVDCGGTCTDLSSEALHCGSCDHACDPGVSCVSGECGGTPECPPGYVVCGWIFTECRDVSADPENCGSCDSGCGDLEYCADGRCVCRPGLAPCPDGCVDVDADPGNCGGCGTPCASVCTGGVCGDASACTLTPCDGACVDTAIDLLNCGHCGNGCAVDQLCFASDCWDYEPAQGCDSCAACDFCPGGEICCDLPWYGPSCVDTDAGCP